MADVNKVWEKDGQHRSKHKVRADRVQFLDSRREQGVGDASR